MIRKEDWLMIKAMSERGVYQKEIAEEVGVHPRTIRRALQQGGPPRGKRSKARKSKLDPYKGKIDELLQQGVWNGMVILREIQEDAPAAVIIDLSRLPSQGRDMGLALRQRKGTRSIPLVFVEGDPKKVARVKDWTNLPPRCRPQMSFALSGVNPNRTMATLLPTVRGEGLALARSSADSVPYRDCTSIS